MADISKLKLPDGTTYNLKDSYVRTNYRALSNNDFDTINATEVNAGDLIVTGVGRFTNGLYGNLSGTATKVSNSLKIQLNGGTTEGTNQFTYDGSAAKTVNVTKSAIGLGNVDNTADANKSVASATTAGSATKATQDESGNNIKATYAASFSISDHTITLKNKNGVSLGTVTVPDNDHYAWGDITGKPSTFPPSTHTHYEIATIGDQRTVATTPDTYKNRLIFQGLKTQSYIGNPGDSGSYSYLLGLRGWGDSSGGDSHELAFNNSGIYWRHGATTTWGNWVKLFTSADTYSGTLTSSQVTTALGFTPTANTGTITSVKTTAGTHTTINVSSGAANFNVPTKTSHLTNDSGFVTTDTKNTAGSTDTSSKIFLIGATSQAANPRTYSDNEVYVTSGVLTTKSVQVGGGSATIQYNSTTQSLDFVFAS
jgi:hypothetical protein